MTAPAPPCPLVIAAGLAPRDFSARLPRRARGIGARRRRRHRGRRTLVAVAVCAVPALAAPHPWASPWTMFRLGDAAAPDGVERAMPFEQGGRRVAGPAFTALDQEPPGASAPLDAQARWDDALPAGPAAGALPAGPAAGALRAGGTALDRVRALTCLTQAIYYEAAREPDAGQRAVAQVVLNRVAHAAYPKTVCGVVYQGAERPSGCQFTFACDGALARLPDRLFWLRAEFVARRALAGFVYAPIGLATHYHTSAVHPPWADSLAFVGTIGAHRFYRLAGPAGAPAAFRVAAYRGGEPIAAPPLRAPGLLPAAPALDPVLIERAFARADAGAEATTLTADHAPVPVYAPALQQRGGDAPYTARTLPRATTIRLEFAGTGQWIARPGS